MLVALLLLQSAIPTPPPEHPRLYLRAQHLPEIRARLAHPLIARAFDRVLADSRLSTAGAAVSRIPLVARSKALLSLLKDDAQAGRDAIGLMTDLLPRADWDLSIQDISREIGLTMLSAGMVYDWCYPLLSADEKTLFVEHAERLARMLEVGYPPTRQSSITSHTGEAMLMRDLLGTGIAIYDEKPYMYEVSAQRVFAEIIPARDFFYPAHRHHQGTGYGQYRFQYEMYCAWLLHRMTGNHYFSPEQQFVPYEWVYKKRPDGKMIAEADVLTGTATRAFMLTAGYYQDRILQGEYLAARDAESIDALDRVLFLDPEIDVRPVAELPLTKYFPFPMSSLIARTSWSASPVIAMLALHEFQFNNHDHLDAGNFTLFYRGPLALDSGVYATYHSDHDQHYYKRTVAHNSVLVCDPDERFVGGRIVNDCGQRWPNERTEPRNLDILLKSGYRVARLLGRDFGPDPAAPRYSYLEGDLTEAYAKKVSRHQRAFVFWNLHSAAAPAALLVLDRLTAAQPGFRKAWLLHSMDQPELREQTAVIRYHGGKLVNFTLLPAADNFRAELIGGEGKEFWVADRNFPPVKTVTPALEAGAWRLEISPLQPSADDLFLNAMAVLDDGQPEPDPPRLLEAGELVGILFSGRAAFFSRSGERLAGPLRLQLPEGLAACLLTGLQEGDWEILSWDTLARQTVAAEAGTLYVEGPGPSLELRRVAPGATIGHAP